MSIRSSFVIALFVLLPVAFAAEPDALAIDANILARHMPYGAIMDPILSLPDLSQVVDYTRCATLPSGRDTTSPPRRSAIKSPARPTP